LVENLKVLQMSSMLDAKLEFFDQACLQAGIDPHPMISIIAYGLEPGGEFQSESTAMVEQIKLEDLRLLQHWMGVLNEGYYKFETGRLVELELPDGRIEQLDPWQNAGSAA
jgi:hypothetical protein